MKRHPKGLIAAALANMGERYGFYTMMAILTLFLQAKFGLDGKYTGAIYSTFYALIYVSSLLGGFIADKRADYKGTIFIGLIVMTVGYVLMAIPTPTPVPNFYLYLGISLFALLIISLGNGLFKGNLQALVGQMYDDWDKANTDIPKLERGNRRDEGYRIFYMFINVGAIFAPFTAVAVRNWWLKIHNLGYSAELPGYCHSYLKGNLSADGLQSMQQLASEVTGKTITDLGSFAKEYLNVFTTGFHYAFAVAILAMLISLFIYVFNKKFFPDPQIKKKDFSEKANTSDMSKEEIKMEAEEIRQRLRALFAVFAVVIFFWFSFHQNGLTLTFFARDYTLLKIGSWHLSAETFQSMNPFFVVFITLIMILFSRLVEKVKGPKQGGGMSTPKKIAIGMFIAGSAYLLMTIASIGLPNYSTINPDQGGVALADSAKVTPWLLISVYFILTVAELFISPLGLSFVSKVAPPQYQGVMQGAWLGATAVGNQLLFIGAILYETVPLWITWSVFVGVTAISGIIMFSMVNWLERVTGEKAE